MTAPDELTPWTPGVIARAVEAHHWPPPTYWIRDMLTGIVSAWAADLENLCIVRKTVKAQRDVVISQEARIEALEKWAEDAIAVIGLIRDHASDEATYDYARAEIVRLRAASRRTPGQMCAARRRDD